MKRIYNLPGLIYSDNKKEIKAVFKSHGLRWTGTKEKPVWSSARESIELVTERSHGVTINAQLIYLGPGDTRLISELTDFLSDFNVEHEDEEVKQEDINLDEEIEVAIATWDIVNKPNEAEMRRSTPMCPDGAPDSFIENAWKEYNKNRLVKVLEIRKRLEGEHGIEPKEDKNRTLLERFG